MLRKAGQGELATVGAMLPVETPMGARMNKRKAARIEKLAAPLRGMACTINGVIPAVITGEHVAMIRSTDGRIVLMDTWPTVALDVKLGAMIVHRSVMSKGR